MVRTVKSKNPIKEIVFRISFAKDLDLEKLRLFCEHPEISRDFSNNYSRGFDAELTTIDHPSSEFKHVGYILKSKEQMILSIKLGRIALHLINGYEPFPAILEKLDRYWNVLQGIFGKVPVTHISVRYINQIDIPKGDTYEMYVNLNVKSKFNAIKNPFIKFELNPDKNKGNIKSDIIVAVGKHKRLILDINVHKTIHEQELTNISDVMMDLRPIKNRVFQDLITERTREMFTLGTQQDKKND